jgi:hypothetical protein
MAAKGSRTVVKRTRDEALEHIKVALQTKSCLFTKQEMSFIRTSCQILGIDSQAATRAMQEEVKNKKIKGPRKVTEYLQAQLMELADRVDKHKRPTPNPAGCTRTGNPMGASARSLGNLTGCADALAEAMAAKYSKGIKAGMKALENAKLDFKNTIDRLAEANKWKPKDTEDWVHRGELACGDLLERAERREDRPETSGSAAQQRGTPRRPGKKPPGI